MFNTIDIYSILRKLAKTDYYQNIYSLSKDMNNIRLFKNQDDFTDIQTAFLKYLNLYNNIYTDIALGEVSEDVLKDTIYEDSYIMYKNKNTSKKLKENENTEKQVPVSGSRWLFKKDPKVGNK